jgi:hypothetical protein
MITKIVKRSTQHAGRRDQLRRYSISNIDYKKLRVVTSCPVSFETPYEPDGFLIDRHDPTSRGD